MENYSILTGTPKVREMTTQSLKKKKPAFCMLWAPGKGPSTKMYRELHVPTRDIDTGVFGQPCTLHFGTSQGIESAAAGERTLAKPTATGRKEFGRPELLRVLVGG